MYFWIQKERDRSPESELDPDTFICHLLLHSIPSSAYCACECPAVTAGASGELVWMCNVCKCLSSPATTVFAEKRYRLEDTE